MSQSRPTEQEIVAMLAKDLTELCKQEFCKVPLENPTEEHWAIPAKYFHQVDQYVQEQILQGKSPKARVKVMSRWIHIANACLENGDFHTLLAIHSALKSEPIHQLKKTLKLLDAETKKILTNLDIKCYIGNGLHANIQAEIFRRIEMAKKDKKPLNVIPFHKTFVILKQWQKAKEEKQEEMQKLKEEVKQEEMQKPKEEVKQEDMQNAALQVSEPAPVRKSSSASIANSLDTLRLSEKIAHFTSAYKEIQEKTVKTDVLKEGIQKEISKVQLVGEDPRIALSKELEPKESSSLPRVRSSSRLKQSEDESRKEGSLSRFGNAFKRSFG